MPAHGPRSVKIRRIADPPQSSNYAKYQTSNPVVRKLIERFYTQVAAIVEPLAPRSVLDAGCGEGETLARLAPLLPSRVAAVDVDPEAVAFTSARFRSAAVSRASVYELPFADAEFELVLCLEVLEHLGRPADAVAELARVSGERLVVSVPHEPWFRAGSLLRGKHPATLGNHPEHVNQFNPSSLRRLLERDLDVLTVKRSFPWLIAVCDPRRSRPARGSRSARPAIRGVRARGDPGASEPASGRSGRG